MVALPKGAKPIKDAKPSKSSDIANVTIGNSPGAIAVKKKIELFEKTAPI